MREYEHEYEWVKTFLESDEHMLWKTTVNRKKTLKPKLLYNKIFIIVWCGVALYMMLPVVLEEFREGISAFGIFFSVFMIAFISGGIIISGKIGRSVTPFVQYVITDRHVFFHCGETTRSILLDDLCLTPESVDEYEDGTGSIDLCDEFDLVNIPSVWAVYRLLERYQHHASSHVE